MQGSPCPGDIADILLQDEGRTITRKHAWKRGSQKTKAKNTVTDMFEELKQIFEAAISQARCSTTRCLGWKAREYN
jgi:hypothetical protein